MQSSANKKGKKRGTPSVASANTISTMNSVSNRSASLLSAANGKTSSSVTTAATSRSGNSTEGPRPSTGSSHTVSASSQGHSKGRISEEHNKIRKRSGSHSMNDSTRNLLDTSEGEKEIGSWERVDKEITEDEAEFERLMMSGKTMKVSLTPNRLRTMEAFEKEKAASWGASSSGASTPSSKMYRDRSLSQPQTAPVPPKIAAISHSSSISMSGPMTTSPVPLSPKGAPPTRLKPRGARKAPDEVDSIVEDIEELDSEDERMGFRRKIPEKQESLMDILKSAPPWETPMNGGGGMGMDDREQRQKQGSRKLQKISGEGRSSFGHNRAMGSFSLPGQQKPLPDEKGSARSSREDSFSMTRNKSHPNLRGGFEDFDGSKTARSNYSSESTKDLVDFFNSVPPPPQLPRTNTLLSDEGDKKKKGLFKNIVAKLGGKGDRQFTEEEEAAFRGTSSPNFNIMGNNATTLARKSSRGATKGGISSDDVKRMRGTEIFDSPMTSPRLIQSSAGRPSITMPKSASTPSKLVNGPSLSSDFSALLEKSLPNPSRQPVTTPYFVPPRPSLSQKTTTDSTTSKESIKAGRDSTESPVKRVRPSTEVLRGQNDTRSEGLRVQTHIHNVDERLRDTSPIMSSPPDTPQQGMRRPLYLPTKVEQSYKDNPKRRSNSHLSRSTTPASASLEHLDQDYANGRSPSSSGLRSPIPRLADSSEMEVVLAALKELQKQLDTADSVKSCREALDQTMLKLVSQGTGRDPSNLGWSLKTETTEKEFKNHQDALTGSLAEFYLGEVDLESIADGPRVVLNHGE